MRRSVLALVPVLAASAVCAVPAVAQGNPISATAQRQTTGWLTRMTDTDGRLTIRVDLAGIDAATPAGHAALLRRAAMAGAILCDEAAPVAHPGTYDAENRACRAATADQVRSQLEAGTSGSATSLSLAGPAVPLAR